MNDKHFAALMALLEQIRVELEVIREVLVENDNRERR
jgi:hypothetical protein